MKKLSIVSICYQNAEGLRITAESLKKQKCRDFEWIVIDGASNDGTIDVIKQFDDIIDYWVSESDSGRYNAMNKGIERASGEYLLFLNSGDYLIDENVTKTIIPMLQGIDFYGCDIIESEPHYKYRKAPDDIKAWRIALEPLPHQSTFIKTELLKSRPYNEKYVLVSDWEQMVYELILKNRTYVHLNLTTSVFDTTGATYDKKYRNLFAEEMEDVRVSLFGEKISDDLKRLWEYYRFVRPYKTNTNADKYIGKISIGIRKRTISGDMKILRNAAKMLFHDIFHKKKMQ